MFERVAPSGVKVYSEVPFREYNAWDHNVALFNAKCFKFKVMKVVKAYKEVYGR
jgi:hypothetical protein